MYEVIEPTARGVQLELLLVGLQQPIDDVPNSDVTVEDAWLLHEFKVRLITSHMNRWEIYC